MILVSTAKPNKKREGLVILFMSSYETNYSYQLTGKKSGIRRPVNFSLLGHAFVPTYQKGVRGKYQLVVEKKRWMQLKSKLKEITRKTTPMSFDERVYSR